MFYNFNFNDHFCYLRFKWHKGNDFKQPLVDYHMTRHAFGNISSPAVANFGIRKIVLDVENDVQKLISQNFSMLMMVFFIMQNS